MYHHVSKSYLRLWEHIVWINWGIYIDLGPSNQGGEQCKSLTKIQLLEYTKEIIE